MARIKERPNQDQLNIQIHCHLYIIVFFRVVRIVRGQYGSGRGGS
jgi:hypothetical protein